MNLNAIAIYEVLVDLVIGDEGWEVCTPEKATKLGTLKRGTLLQLSHIFWEEGAEEDLDPGFNFKVLNDRDSGPEFLQAEWKWAFRTGWIVEKNPIETGGWTRQVCTNKMMVP